MDLPGTNGRTAFARLRKLADRPVVERCDLCGKDIPGTHDHLAETAVRRIVCACQACAILFSGGEGKRFKRVPTRIHVLDDFAMSDGAWDALRLPINLAFFYRRGVDGRVIACYPSPAGATESQLSLEAWDEIARENPILDSLDSDVEALLVDRVAYGRNAGEPAYFLVPIDRCFALVGLIRLKWSGLSGGTEVWKEITGFFEQVRRDARPVRKAAHA